MKHLLPLLLTSIALAKPNFIIFLTDDQGYGDLSCFGGDHVTTPHLDQMAAEGAKLTSFYVGGPVCTPSRASLMSGCYPKRIGMTPILLPASPIGLNPSETTIAETLKTQGYNTGLIGKWHLGHHPEFSPLEQGFDKFWGIPYSHDIHPFNPLHGTRFTFPPLPLLDNGELIEEDPDADYLTKRITTNAIKFIEDNKDDPFFLYIAHPMPHEPMHASPRFMNQADQETLDLIAQEDGNIDYDNRNRLIKQCIQEVDWSMGQILDTLQALELDEETFVIFFTDNGPGRSGSAAPLKGKKGSTYEGGMRVPAIVRWPGKIKAGQVNDELMTCMDLLPTFAHLAGSNEVPAVDGKDIWPCLTEGAASPHEEFFYYGGSFIAAVRSGEWKYHLGTAPTGPKEPTLYNLKSDIGERKNVISEHPELAASLHQRALSFDQDLIKNRRPAGRHVD